MAGIARDLLWPTDSNLLARLVFLYVGQGSSTVILVSNGGAYRTLVLDIHLDENLGGIDVPRLMSDLLDGERLAAFVNSHPHNDHTRGVEKLHQAVAGIDAIWHSGHIPSAKHSEAYDELMDVIDEVIEAGGEETILEASRTPFSIGEAECYCLSPAKYVVDDISDETPEGRDRRIHERCAVLRLGKDDSWVMLPGDADLIGWQAHITNYHRERLPSSVLAAAHHGSRTFFKQDEEDEPYTEALKEIDPQHIVISAPKREESPHKHPHKDAVELYTAQVGNEEIYHTGADRHCFIVDLYRDGTMDIRSDEGRLIDAYGLGNGDNGGGNKLQAAPTRQPSITHSRPRDVREAPPFA